jgi:hypothetical protein
MKDVTNFEIIVTSDEDDVTPLDTSAIQAALAESGMELDEECSRDQVMLRLEEAIRLVHRTTGRVGPKGYGQAMPDYAYSNLDLWYQHTQEAWEREHGDFERNRPTIGATRQEIAEADEALAWIPRFVTEERYRKALNSWLLAKATRRPWTKVTKRAGMVHRTAISRRDKAITLIVFGLTIEAIEQAKAEEPACT